MAVQCFGCDLGTCNLKVYSRETDTIHVEKNMVAIEGRYNMIAFGDEAYDMYEKAPSNIEVSYPMSFGNIASINHLQLFLKRFLEKYSKGALKGSEFVIALPCDVQDRVFTTLIQETGLKPKSVVLVDKPVATGLGLGIDVKQAQGVMIVDIGADTTEISVLSLGGIVISKLIKVGGNKIDESISNAIRKEYNFYIGSKTAEGIKRQLGFNSTEEDKVEICGRNLLIGLPSMLTVDGAFVSESIKDQLKLILDAVKMILERTPPELGVDIIRNGIYLTGGGAKLKGLDQLMADTTNIKVTLADKPEECTARGLSRIINEKEFRSLTFETKEQAYH